MKAFYSKELNKFTPESLKWYKVEVKRIGKDFSTGIESRIIPGISEQQVSDMVEQYGIPASFGNGNICVKILSAEDASFIYGKVA